MRRRVFLFENEFQAVGQWLPQAEHLDLGERNADAIGPATILHPGRDPAPNSTKYAAAVSSVNKITTILMTVMVRSMDGMMKGRLSVVSKK